MLMVWWIASLKKRRISEKNKPDMKKRNILLTPGPTPVPPQALALMAEPIFHHRTPQYRKIFNRVSHDLKEIFQTQNDVFTFTSSGTGAMEASIVNFLSPGDLIIVAHAGKFGERWLNLAKAYGIHVIEIKAPYGESISPTGIEKTLKENPSVKAVYTTHCETSTGVTYDIQKIASIVSKTNAILVVDAISGLAADPLPQDEWKVDVVVSGSQKALMLPPGLGFMSVSQKAWGLNQSAKCPRFYYDLALYKKALQDSDTPFTPALTIVIALEETLKIIKDKGMINLLEETRALANATREALQAIGLKLFSKSGHSNVLTAVCVPNGIDGEKLIKVMRDDKGVTLAGGQGEMKGKIFRIAHMGFITKEDLFAGIEILCETLNEFGYVCNAKEATQRFIKSLTQKTEKVLK